MNQFEHYNFEEELLDMQTIDMQSLVASRLEDFADQIRCLYANGYYEEAELIRREGMDLAAAYDDEEVFLYILDLTEIK
jgi:hypothetical protein